MQGSLTLDFALAPPFDGAVDVEDEIGDTGSEHHGCLDTGATQKDNSPNGKIEGVIDEPNPPRFGIAHGHENDTTEINAVRSGIKPAQALAGDETEQIADDEATSNTANDDDDGSFESEFAAFDFARGVGIFAPLPEAPKRKRYASEKIKSRRAKKLVAKGGVAHEGVVKDTEEILDAPTLCSKIGRGKTGEENRAAKNHVVRKNAQDD